MTVLIKGPWKISVWFFVRERETLDVDQPKFGEKGTTLPASLITQ